VEHITANQALQLFATARHPTQAIAFQVSRQQVHFRLIQLMGLCWLISDKFQARLSLLLGEMQHTQTPAALNCAAVTMN
jgi:hypothetical protein